MWYSIYVFIYRPSNMQLTGGAVLIEPVFAISCLQGRRTRDCSSLSKQVNLKISNPGAQIMFCQIVPKQLIFGRFGVPRLSEPDIQKHGTSSHRGAGPSIENDVEFPGDYTELLEQVKVATRAALQDSKHLLEIEFPTAGLDSVSGDDEGGIEMNASMTLIREFCGCFLKPEKAVRTRIFFPEAKEAEFARKTVFEGASFKLDYLTKPSFLEDFGFGKNLKIADRIQPTDEIFLVAYPYFNLNEMLVVEELYRDAVVNSERKMIIFNGELDRMRGGYYPSFFFPKIATLSKTFLPKIETVYYIHNFKGPLGGTLFRSYPGPWKVLRKQNGKHVCLHQQEIMPSLKDVAVDILPSA